MASYLYAHIYMAYLICPYLYGIVSWELLSQGYPPRTTRVFDSFWRQGARENQILKKFKNREKKLKKN